MLKSNLRHEDCTSFFERLLWNALYVSGGFVVYKLISFLTISYDRFLSIIIFQFIVLALLCTLIGYIQMLYHNQREKDQLIENLRVENLQSRCDALVNQINPHFFYNTLFMVYRMAQQDGNEDIARLSLNLSRYYRYITTIPEHDVPLRDEVNHIRQYLEIQGMRFSPRVRVHMNELPEEIAQENIPPLILQPVVENAFVHGVKNKQSGGVVEVSFIMEQDRFGVTVYDNGGTMDAENVRRLDERMRAGELAEGSALYNLYRRMELLYGDHYELKLESFADGLSVTILFPRTGR